MNSSVMIAPARNTPPSAARYLQAKYNMIDKGILKSSPPAQRKLCQLRQHSKGTCDYCSPKKEKIVEDAMSTSYDTDWDNPQVINQQENLFKIY